MFINLRYAVIKIGPSLLTINLVYLNTLFTSKSVYWVQELVQDLHIDSHSILMFKSQNIIYQHGILQ